MHQDFSALEVCCKHYQTTYLNENMRKVINRNRSLLRRIRKLELDIYCLRVTMAFWQNVHADCKYLLLKIKSMLRSFN